MHPSTCLFVGASICSVFRWLTHLHLGAADLVVASVTHWEAADSDSGDEGQRRRRGEQHGGTLVRYQDMRHD